MTDAIWNVRAMVADRVAATTATEALDKLTRRLEVAGFAPLVDHGAGDCYEVEVDDDVADAIRGEWAW